MRILNHVLAFVCSISFVCSVNGFKHGGAIQGEDDDLHPVFIFGPMKRGEPMHHWLENPENGFCQFIAEAVTKQSFPMVIATKYNVPIVIYKPEMGHPIKGELYEMNLRMIKNLDKYEFLPNEVIGRIEPVKYQHPKTNQTVSQPAIIYVKYYLDDKPHWLDYPFMSEYHSKGDHGRQFIERPKRKVKKRKKKKSKINGKPTGKQINNTLIEKEEVYEQYVNSTTEISIGNTTVSYWANNDIEGDIRRKISRMEKSRLKYEKKQQRRLEKENAQNKIVTFSINLSNATQYISNKTNIK